MTLSSASFSFWAHLRASVCEFLRLVFPKTVLKNSRKIVCKVFQVQIVIKFFTEELFERFKSARSDQIHFKRRNRKTSHSKGTTSVMSIFIDNIARLYRCAEAGEELVIGGGVFTVEQRGRTKQRPPRRPGGCHGLGFRPGFRIQTNTLNHRAFFTGMGVLLSKRPTGISHA